MKQQEQQALAQKTAAKNAAAASERAAAQRLKAEQNSDVIAAAVGAGIFGLVAGGLADGIFANGDAPWSSPAGKFSTPHMSTRSDMWLNTRHTQRQWPGCYVV